MIIKIKLYYRAEQISKISDEVRERSTLIKLHSFFVYTRHLISAHVLIYWSIFRNGFERTRPSKLVKRNNLSPNGIRWGNRSIFRVTDRDMPRIKMPIGLSVDTCISLHSLCTRCRTSSCHICSVVVIIFLNIRISLTLGTWCNIRWLVIVVHWLHVNALSEFVILLFLLVDDAMRNVYLQFSELIRTLKLLLLVCIWWCWFVGVCICHKCWIAFPFLCVLSDKMPQL